MHFQMHGSPGDKQGDDADDHAANQAANTIDENHPNLLHYKE